MNRYESIGYVASMLVLAAFCVRGMLALRVLAIASNVAFIAYAAVAGLQPVLLLHAVLLPLNAWRLYEIVARAEAVIGKTAPQRPTAAVMQRRRSHAPPTSAPIRRRSVACWRRDCGPSKPGACP